MLVIVLLGDTFPPSYPTPCPAQGLLSLQTACYCSSSMPDCLVSAGVHLLLVEVLQRDSDLEGEELTDDTHSKPAH